MYSVGTNSGTVADAERVGEAACAFAIVAVLAAASFAVALTAADSVNQFNLYTVTPPDARPYWFLLPSGDGARSAFVFRKGKSQPIDDSIAKTPGYIRIDAGTVVEVRGDYAGDPSGAAYHSRDPSGAVFAVLVHSDGTVDAGGGWIDPGALTLTPGSASARKAEQDAKDAARAEQERRDAVAAATAKQQALAAAKKREEERAKARAACASIYGQTANKKLSDLTVAEEQSVRACQALGLYH